MHPLAPYLPFPGFLFAFFPLLILVVLWTIIIKGFALWHAARNSQKWWFMVMLVVNSLGILEVIYLIWFRRPHDTDTLPPSTPAQDSSAQA